MESSFQALFIAITYMVLESIKLSKNTG